MSKSAITVFLCSIFWLECLLPRVEFGDLGLVPELFRHFEEHLQESPGISFLDFLYLHYGDSQHADQDSKTHGKLPFSKTHRTTSFHLANDLLPVRISTKLPLVMEIEEVSYFEAPVRSITTSIWQPPKI